KQRNAVLLMIHSYAVETVRCRRVAVEDYQGGTRAIGADQGLPEGRESDGEFYAVYPIAHAAPRDFANATQRGHELNIQQRDVCVNQVVVGRWPAPRIVDRQFAEQPSEVDQSVVVGASDELVE